MIYPSFISTPVAPNIYVYHHEEDDYFIQLVQYNLEILKTRQIGRDLLEAIGSGRHKVEIEYHEMINQAIPADFIGSQNREAGSDAIIQWTAAPGNSGVSMEAGVLLQPTYIVLAHELIHAWRISQGKIKIDVPNKKDFYALWTNYEEYKTITGSKKFSENAFRAAFFLPLRLGHITFVEFKTYFSLRALALKYIKELNEKLYKQNDWSAFPKLHHYALIA